jgi:hypothetical protein
MRFTVLLPAVALALVACNTGPKEVAPVTAEPTTAAPRAQAPAPKPAADGATMKLGTAIDAAAEKVALAEVAKRPDAYVGKTFATTGTVTAVCQHMGCWMEIKDDASEAHIKMAGHAFFVPKAASGRKARVMATLMKNPEPEPSCGHGGGKGCRAEAEAQLGHALPKLELVAQGVEIL